MGCIKRDFPVSAVLPDMSRCAISTAFARTGALAAAVLGDGVMVTLRFLVPSF